MPRLAQMDDARGSRSSDTPALEEHEPFFSPPTTTFTDYFEDEEDVALSDGYNYEQIINEAQLRSHLTGDPPEFVLKNPGAFHRTVAVERLNSKNVKERVEGELEWVIWDERSGFWKLEDEDGVNKVVKYINTGLKGYKVYNGVDGGFGDDPIAWPRNGKAPVDLTVASSDDETDVPKHTLRQRTPVQKTPFSTEKKSHKRKMAGKPPTSSDTEAAGKKRPMKRVSAGSSRSRASRDGNTAESHTRDTAITTSTLFTSRRDPGSPMTIPLKMTNTATELFAKVTRAWERQLDGHRCTQITAKCPWKEKNREYTVVEDLEETFAVLVEDIGRAPCWDKNEACEVEVIVEG